MPARSSTACWMTPTGGRPASWSNGSGGRVSKSTLTPPETATKNPGKDRRLVSWSDPDGTVTLSGIGLDPVKVAEAKNRIDRLARELRTGGETRSMDQLRADIFLELLTGPVTSQGQGVSISPSTSPPSPN
jgi:hypothetical protein